MKKIFTLFTLIAIGPFIHAQDTKEKINDLVEAYANLGKFNGSILVAEKGKILVERGYGYKDISKNTFNDAHTIYQIASITKTFTSAVVLKLVELKKISLTDKLSTFYPGFLKGDSVTIENLLTHTSGISDRSEDTTFHIYSGSTEKEFIESLKKRNYDFSPGSGWKYSNSGYILLGYIIQKITGTTYYDAIRKYIFKPLLMNHSAFDFIHLASPDKATGYWSFPENDSVISATIIDSSAPRAAGAIYSTVGDLYKWHQGLETGKIISQSSVNMAYTPYKNRYGYGWLIDSFEHKKVVFHGGDIWGFQSNLVRVPEDDICIVMLNNIEDAELVLIGRKVLAILYNQPYLLPAKNEIKLDNTTMQKYTGDYELQPGMVVKVKKENNRLMMTTDRKQELYAQKGGLFMIDNGIEPKVITFEQDVSGKVIALSFDKGGKKIICKKIN